MSSTGYIYIPNWERFQHYKTRRPPWIKLYTDLAGNDAWIDLHPSDAKLLVGIWMLTSQHGNGRISVRYHEDNGEIKATSRWLCDITGVPWSGRYQGLNRLIQAGFIEVRASKAASTIASTVLAPETETETETPISPYRSTNGKRSKAISRCRFLYHQAQAEGEADQVTRDWLMNEYRHDPTIVTEAIGTPTKGAA